MPTAGYFLSLGLWKKSRSHGAPYWIVGKSVVSEPGDSLQPIKGGVDFQLADAGGVYAKQVAGRP